MTRRIALGIAALAAVGLLWIGGETHYRACVEAAEAANPVQVMKSASILDPGQVVVGKGARRRAVDGCSRLPF